MLVVTDTTPINYLILIGQVGVLPTMFGTVVVPQAVADELRDLHTPEAVRQWIAALPTWCIVQSPQGPLDPSLLYLGEGEREAIALCREIGADALLTDDTKVYEEARARGIEVVRTLALLERASRQGLLDLPAVLAQLQATTFYAPERVINDMLARHTVRNPARPLRPPES